MIHHGQTFFVNAGGLGGATRRHRDETENRRTEKSCLTLGFTQDCSCKVNENHSRPAGSVRERLFKNENLFYAVLEKLL